MPKLHEVIAVKDDRKRAAAKFIQEAATTFIKRQDHFDAKQVIFEPVSEEFASAVQETEHTEMVTTVRNKLNFVEGHIINFLDVSFQQESANMEAKADIVIDAADGSEVKLIENVPVVFLVQLESYLGDLRKVVYDNIPTLDPKIAWEKDDTENNVWKQKRPIESQKTKKVSKPIVLYPATDKHPAQTQLINEDIVVGKTVRTSSTGKFSPKEKSDMLDRIDRLVSAVKKARSRANSTDAPKMKIGKKIFDFINSSNGDTV